MKLKNAINEKKYGVYMSGGSIGRGKNNYEPSSIHDSQEEAKTKTKRMNENLSPGEKKYYKIKYTVRAIK